MKARKGCESDGDFGGEGESRCYDAASQMRKKRRIFINPKNRNSAKTED